MRGDGNSRILVSIEIKSQATTHTAYYVCREQSYKADLFDAMGHIAKRHDTIRSIFVKRVDSDVIFASEIIK
jgi:hypothetical protein